MTLQLQAHTQVWTGSRRPEPGSGPDLKKQISATLLKIGMKNDDKKMSVSIKVKYTSIWKLPFTFLLVVQKLFLQFGLISDGFLSFLKFVEKVIQMGLL